MPFGDDITICARMDYILPPRAKTDEGRIRKVGFELEFARLETDDAAELIRRLFGGRIERNSRFEIAVKDTEVGDYKVETDSSLLKGRPYEDLLRDMGVEPEGAGWREPLEKVLGDAASIVVPNEIVTPPLDMDKLQHLDKLVDALRDAGAVGTKDSFLNAFGLHINPEVPATDAQTLLRYLQSYVLLHDRLRREADVDLSRRLTAFIDEFPREYALTILEPDYSPDVRRLITDYLKDNPTRNRPLDMLPLFTMLKPEVVKLFNVEEDLIKPRPAFHYRLPDFCLHDETRTPVVEWNRWLEVERLAGKPDLIQEMAEEYRRIFQFEMNPFRKNWSKESEKWKEAINQSR